MYLSSVPEDPLNVFPASKYILIPLSDLLYGNLEESLGKVVSDQLYQISGLLIRNEVCDAASRLYEEGSPRKERVINRLMSESVRGETCVHSNKGYQINDLRYRERRGRRSYSISGR